MCASYFIIRSVFICAGAGSWVQETSNGSTKSPFWQPLGWVKLTLKTVWLLIKMAWEPSDRLGNSSKTEAIFPEEGEIVYLYLSFSLFCYSPLQDEKHFGKCQKNWQDHYHNYNVHVCVSASSANYWMQTITWFRHGHSQERPKRLSGGAYMLTSFRLSSSLCSLRNDEFVEFIYHFQIEVMVYSCCFNYSDTWLPRYH